MKGHFRVLVLYSEEALFHILVELSPSIFSGTLCCPFPFVDNSEVFCLPKKWIELFMVQASYIAEPHRCSGLRHFFKPNDTDEITTVSMFFPTP